MKIKNWEYNAEKASPHNGVKGNGARQRDLQYGGIEQAVILSEGPLKNPVFIFF